MVVSLPERIALDHDQAARRSGGSLLKIVLPAGRREEASHIVGIRSARYETHSPRAVVEGR